MQRCHAEQKCWKINSLPTPLTVDLDIFILVGLALPPLLLLAVGPGLGQGLAIGEVAIVKGVGTRVVLDAEDKVIVDYGRRIINPHSIEIGNVRLSFF